MRTVVYTAITGSKDQLKSPEMLDKGFDYLCFTDTPGAFKSGTCWQILPILKEPDPVRQARKIKILAHKYVGGYDRSVWIDGTIRPRRPLKELLDRYVPPNKFAVWAHYQRDCLYTEVRACISLRKDNQATMQKQVEQYRGEGYPKRFGMVRSGVLIRMHNDPDVMGAMEFWWHQVLTASRRDQLSFNYMTWKKGFKYMLLKDQGLYNRYFRGHKHSR